MLPELQWEDFQAIAQVWVAHSAGRLRIACNEKDDTTDPDPEAREHLKLDEKRLGRDFRLYSFMEEVGGPGSGIGDFAFTASVVQHTLPEAFAPSRQAVQDLDRFLPDNLQGPWRALW